MSNNDRTNKLVAEGRAPASLRLSTESIEYNKIAPFNAT